MATVAGYDGPLSDKLSEETLSENQELVQARKDLEMLKSMNPFRVVEMAIEIQIEKMRVKEAIAARDATIQRLSDAYLSLRQKATLIETLKQELESNINGSLPRSPKGNLVERLENERLNAHILSLEATITELRIDIQTLKGQARANNQNKVVDPPPCYDVGAPKHSDLNPERKIGFSVDRDASLNVISPPSASQSISTSNTLSNLVQNDAFDMGGDRVPTVVHAEEPADRVKARFAVLATFPVPSTAPDDTLKPIIIPPPFTLHEFLSSISGPLKPSLANYRVLQSVTTTWCPEREEHGYFYAPVFKCSTNPRVATAHRWSAVDVTARMNKATECFFNKEGLWYYAGSYKGFKLDELSVKEWAGLSSEVWLLVDYRIGVKSPEQTSQAIVKETIAGRKNTSPQNIYETSQLYASGALKVACVGLQCVGFNDDVYRAILDQSAKFVQAKWKTLAAAAIHLPLSDALSDNFKPMPSNGSSLASPMIIPGGLGTGSPTWNSALAISSDRVVSANPGPPSGEGALLAKGL